MNRGSLEMAGIVLARLRESCRRPQAATGSFLQRSACPGAATHNLEPRPRPDGLIYVCSRCGWWYRPEEESSGR